MAYNLTLPAKWASQRWKVKIRDRERLEPPHISIIRSTRTWRVCLRTGDFLDDEPEPSEVPRELLDLIMGSWLELRDEWNQMYPENPVEGTER